VVILLAPLSFDLGRPSSSFTPRIKDTEKSHQTTRAFEEEHPLIAKDFGERKTLQVFPLVQSSYLAIDPSDVAEWRIRNSEGGDVLEAIISEPDTEAIYLTANQQTGGIWSIDAASRLGEYMMDLSDTSIDVIPELSAYLNMDVQVLAANRLVALLGIKTGTLEEAARVGEKLLGNPLGLVIEPNALVYPVSVPDDPDYSSSWELAKLELEAVWKRFGYSPEAALERRPVIAVIDNGASGDDFHYWINEDEIPGNDLDDDDNGQIDDVYGYNFFQHNADLSYVGGHGSRVSYFATSITNNGIGTASPASSAALMRVIFYEENSGAHFDALDAMLYAIDNGADVLNCSFVSGTSLLFTTLLGLARDANVIVVAAAGNDGRDLISYSLFPVVLEDDNLIGVGASNVSDKRASSNYGEKSVDLFAPGAVSSFSTPLVSSTVALLKALKPEANYEEIKAAIMAGVDPVPALSGLCVSGGRLNVKGAVEALLDIDLDEPGWDPLEPEIPALEVNPVGETSLQLSWSSMEPVGGFQVWYSEAGGAFLPLEPTDVFTGESTGVLLQGLLPSTKYAVRIRAFNGPLSSPWLESPILETGELLPQPLHFWNFNSIESMEMVSSGSIPIPISLTDVQFDGVTSDNSAVWFSGDHEGILIPDAETLNEGVLEEFTVAFWIRVPASGLKNTSVIYEQGGYWRGLNILVERGWILAHGWNRVKDESNWEGTSLYGGKLESHQWNHVALVLKAGPEVVSDGLKLYLNGELAAQGEASQLWVQKDNNGIGQVQQSTVYRNRQVLQLPPLQASLDDLAFWNRALSVEQIKTLILSWDAEY